MLREPIIGPTPDPPARDGRTIRFGCGFLFGLPLGFLAAWRLLYARPGLCLGVSVGVGVFIGILSMVKGDRFWFSMGDCFRRR